MGAFGVNPIGRTGFMSPIRWAGTSVDLSVFGMKVHLVAPAPPETLARLSFMLPDDPPTLEILSLVVRIDNDGWVFRFVNLTQSEHARLSHTMRWLAGGNSA